MALFTDKTVFLHIPKTGGMWVKNVLNNMGIEVRELGHQHEHFPSLYNLKPKSFFDSKYVFTFVRHPITWYQSRWAFRMKMGWQPKHPLDWNCASNDFNDFVARALSYSPNGWCTWLFGSYYNHFRLDGRPMVDFIGRTENLAEDLAEALVNSGYDIDANAIKIYCKVNESVLDGRPSKQLAKYTPELYNKIISVESQIINRFYWDVKLVSNDYVISQ